MTKIHENIVFKVQILNVYFTFYMSWLQHMQPTCEKASVLIYKRRFARCGNELQKKQRAATSGSIKQKFPVGCLTEQVLVSFGLRHTCMNLCNTYIFLV